MSNVRRVADYQVGLLFIGFRRWLRDKVTESQVQECVSIKRLRWFCESLVFLESNRCRVSIGVGLSEQRRIEGPRTKSGLQESNPLAGVDLH